MTSQITFESNYIHEDPVLKDIYDRAVGKFMKKAGESIVFFELADYIGKQISWKKQSIYYHGLPILREVCQRIAEDFQAGCDYVCPDPTCYRDLYFAVFE